MTPTPLDDRREYSDDDGCARIEVEVFKGGVHIVLGQRRAGETVIGMPGVRDMDTATLVALVETVESWWGAER